MRRIFGVACAAAEQGAGIGASVGRLSDLRVRPTERLAVPAKAHTPLQKYQYTHQFASTHTDTHRHNVMTVRFVPEKSPLDKGLANNAKIDVPPLDWPHNVTCKQAYRKHMKISEA